MLNGVIKTSFFTLAFDVVAAYTPCCRVPDRCRVVLPRFALT